MILFDDGDWFVESRLCGGAVPRARMRAGPFRWREARDFAGRLESRGIRARLVERGGTAAVDLLLR